MQREVLHADETTVQVLKEPGRAVDSKSYMWVYRRGNDGLAPIILFEYRPGRRGEYAEQFLDGFHGCLHTDGYAGYKRLTNVTRCCCWAQVRRKFVEAMPQKTAANGALTPAQQGRRYCDQLFAKESEILKLEPEKRQEARLAEEGPILRAFWCWLDEMSAQPLAGQLKKAVGYTPGPAALSGKLSQGPALPALQQLGGERDPPIRSRAQELAVQHYGPRRQGQRGGVQYRGDSQSQ